MRTPLLLALLLVALAGCDAAASFDPNDYAGAYAGTLTFSDFTRTNETLSAEARVEVGRPSLGQMRLTLTAFSDIHFDGAYSEDGATLRRYPQDSPLVQTFTVSPDGQITGEGELALSSPTPFRSTFTIGGTWTPDRIAIRIVETVVESGNPDVVGATYPHGYVLERVEE